MACGAGRNALRLAEAGFEVSAVDVSEVAIDMAKTQARIRRLDVDWQVGDLDDMKLSADSYDLITMIRYVNRAIWPGLYPALGSNGWLLMEQHLRSHRDVIGPTDDYRLEPGELLRAFPSMRIIEYSESIEGSDRQPGLVASARLLACKGDPGW